MNQTGQQCFSNTYTVFYQGTETFNETVLHNDLEIGITHIFIEHVMYVYKECEAITLVYFKRIIVQYYYIRRVI